ncbi:hypothetical protein WN943_023475 [Citrus x changshan-huyou]
MLPCSLILTSEGRIVLRSTEQGQDSIIADDSQSASSASMLDSGSFVLYDSDGKVIWQTFDHPTDTILPTQRLLAGIELFPGISKTDPSTGKFRLKMQNDGNLIQYPKNTPDTAPYSYWTSFTDGKGDNVSLNLDENGHLFLLNSTGFNIRNLTKGENPTEGMMYLMKIDSDGIFRLICSHYPRQLEFGCARNYTAESCSNKAIEELKNTVWEDVSYSVLSKTTEQNCQEACLKDCNCEAALYKDEECKMQRLPLRFGRRKLSDSDIAFIKVDATASSNSGNPFSRDGKKAQRKDIIIISCLFVAVVILILATFGIFIYRYRVRSYRIIPGNGSARYCEDIALLSFSYAELEKMTDGFKEEIGRGSSGTVYKGTMINGKFVAVKRLQKMLAEGEREFQTEMKAIRRTHHRNLVRLLGYSFDVSNKILVYEYMSNGSLADVYSSPPKNNLIGLKEWELLVV